MGKIVIYPSATFTTPLPTIPAEYEVIDLRTTIPTNDSNRTQNGITLSLYAQETDAGMVTVPAGTTIRSLLTTMPKNLKN
jgi:hypothetical protein